jgi:hypothetical protein
MSGNQYVYSIEIANADGGSNRLDLVHKNRKSIMARAAVLRAKLERTHRLVQQTHHRDLTLLTFVHHDRSAVCDSWHFIPVEEYHNDLPGVNLTVRAWIIKKAKPEGPVRGTLKENMPMRPVSIP